MVLTVPSNTERLSHVQPCTEPTRCTTDTLIRDRSQHHSLMEQSTRPHRSVAVALSDDRLSRPIGPRELTIMFCDLVDSTPLACQLELEVYHDIIRDFHRTVAKIIEPCGGYLAQYLGDGVLAYFGYPNSLAHEARSAVHSALAILEALGALNRRLRRDYGIHLAARLGIHTGPVFMTAIETQGYPNHLALGPTPNIASRLQQLATPNTIVLSHTTVSRLQGAFACQELGIQSLKGVSTCIPVYQLIPI